MYKDEVLSLHPSKNFSLEEEKIDRQMNEREPN